MNFRRLAALLLAVVMTMTLLASCGREVEEQLPTPGTVDPAITGIPEDTEAPETTPEPTTTPEETTPEPTTTPEETTTEPTTAATTAATTEATTKKTSKDDYTVESMSETQMYATMSLNVRKGPSTDFGKIGALAEGEEVTVTGRASTGWYQVSYKGQTGYVSNLYMSATPVAAKPAATTVDDEEESEEVNEPGVTKATAGNTSTVTPTENTTPTGNWVKDNGVEYMYSLITQDRYKTALDQIAAAVQNLEPTVTITGVTKEEIMDISAYIVQMVGTGYCYFDRVSKRETLGDAQVLTLEYYVNTKAEADNMVSKLNAAADKVVSAISGYSDYNKVKYVYEWICRNSGYGGTYGASTYGPLVAGGSTCLGYAKGTFYLLSRAGFDVIYVCGVGDEATHAWVKVKIGGKWYNVDTTWGDPQGSSTADDPNYVCYDFLCVTDTYMRQTRKQVFDLSRYYQTPSATSNELNWYVLNGYYAENYDQGLTILKKQLDAAIADTTSTYCYLRLQFANESDFVSFNEHYNLSTFQSEVVKPVTSKRVTNKKFSDATNEIKRTRSMTFRMRKG